MAGGSLIVRSSERHKRPLEDLVEELLCSQETKVR